MRELTFTEFEKIVEDEIWDWVKDTVGDDEETNILLQVLPDLLSFSLYCEQDEDGWKIIPDKKEEK